MTKATKTGKAPAIRAALGMGAALALAFALTGCDNPAGGNGGGGNRGNFVMVSAGGTHTLAICEDGRLWG